MNRENEELMETGNQKKRRWIFAALGAFLGVGLVFLLWALFAKEEEPKQVIRYVDNIEETEETTGDERLDELLMYLKDMDDSVLYNSSALDSVGDYNTLVKNKLSDIKGSIDSTVNYVNNYINEQDLDDEQKQMLSLLCENLKALKEKILDSETKIYYLIDEYADAEEDRANEIARELEEIVKSFDTESIRKSYEEILSYVKENPQGETDEFYNGLTNKLERFLDKEIKSLKELLSGETLSLSMELQRYLENLKTSMNNLHSAILENEADINNISKTLKAGDRTDTSAVTNEIKNITNEISKENTEIKNLGDEIKNISTQNKDIDESVKNISKNVTDLQGDFKTAYSDVKTMLESIEKLLNTQQESSESYKEEISKLKEVLEGLETNLSTLISENFKELNGSITKMNTEMEENFTDLSEQYNSVLTVVNESDGSIKEYLQNMQNNINAKFDSVFQSVSDGKVLLASALLTKGVECPGDATFYEIYEAILRIPQQLVIGTDYLPGEISYDYHYHTDGKGEIIHATQVGVDQAGGCFTVPIKHVHSGNSVNGGGCYTVKHTGSRLVKCTGGAYCGQGPYPADTSGQEYYVGTCPVCGGHLSCYNSPGYVSCDNTHYENYTYYSIGCGMNENTVIGYKCGCSLSDGCIVGAHIVYNNAYSSGYNGADINNFSFASPSPLTVPSGEIIEIDEGIEENTETIVPTEKQEVPQEIQQEQQEKQPEETDETNVQQQEMETTQEEEGVSEESIPSVNEEE